jgi:NDP-sugar pyrophosphorylase family protein
MNMPQITIAIVCYADMSILQTNIDGLAAGEYLIKNLGAYEHHKVMAITNDCQLDIESPLFKKFLNLKVCTINDLNIEEWRNNGILLIDVRAWLSSQNLESIFSYIEKAKTNIQFCESNKFIPSAYREVMTLAIYVPPEKVTSNLFKKMGIINEIALEAFVNLDVLDIAQKIYCDDENFSQFSLLINSYVDLAAIEQHIYLKKATHAMQTGVRIRDPQSISIRGNLSCGFGVEIDANVIFEGDVVLGDNVKINANSVLRDCRIGNGTVINAFSLIEQSSVGEDSFIGPFSRIRPQCVVGNKVQIGNYVEIKNSNIGDGSRINHHTFIGDSLLADYVTIGAGTITCNHDGIGVSQTVIEQGAYIGSGCNLVAPLNIGAGATIGAGSTITSDVPAAKLTLARSIQTTVHGWVRPKSSRVGK